MPPLLAAIEHAYGVDRHVLLAIWGVESAYGTSMGSRSVVRSLATLAIADQRRAPFWRSELVAALRILQDGQTAPEAFVGSWAGATGHTQFIPSAYAAHAVDFDKDGRRDIWGTVADALASTANYLRTSGWSANAPWGFEVTLPPGFDYSWSAPGRPQALSQWLAAGVRVPAGPANLQLGLSLQLVLPAGARGPAFLVTRNFRAMLRYNNATSYALAVGHLADPHRRRRAADCRLAIRRQAAGTRRARGNASVCWLHVASTPAASTASWATRRAPPSARPSAPSNWPRTAIRLTNCCSGCAPILCPNRLILHLSCDGRETAACCLRRTPRRFAQRDTQPANWCKQCETRLC